MPNRTRLYEAVLILLLAAGSCPAAGSDSDPTSCLPEIERVCAKLEDHLETCLSQRGTQLSASCRDVLKSAMTFMADRSGPASCVSDVQRFCPDLKSNALAQCMVENQSKFSDTCQKYMQTASQK